MTMITKYFDSNRFKLKIYFLVCLFAIDIVMNSFTQFLYFGSQTAIVEYNLEGLKVAPKIVSIILFVLQLIIQLIMLFTTLSLFFNTFQCQLGILSEVVKEFIFTFIFIALYPLLFIAERLFRLIFLAKKENFARNVITIWDFWPYLLIYILKFFVGFCYYIFVLDAAYELGKAKYYKPDEKFLKKNLIK